MKKKNVYLIVCIFLVIILVVLYCIVNSNTNPDINKLEHVISIKCNNKKIDAVTGSFCYKNGTCIDKINFQDFKYDIISSYYDNKLYIDNLDGSINSIELFDYNIRKYTNIKVDYTNEYIITPKVNGMYIFIINTTYQGKIIEYYFMSNINKISGDEIKLNIELKENSLTDKGLIMVVKNLSDKDLQYGEPYVIEKYEDGFWKTLNPINEMSFILPAYSLLRNDSKELRINWEYGYGKLKGKYRIVKSFSYDENDNYISFNKYLEFEIK